MKVAIQRLPKNTVKLTITVEADKVKESYNKIFSEIAENIEVDGFRKGKAPADLVEEKIDHNKLNSKVISDLINTYYPQAIKNKILKP
jgi:trigger factor